MAISPRPVFRFLPVASSPVQLASATLLLLITACGDSGPSGPDPLDAIASVAVAPPQVTVDVGSTSQLSATVKNGHLETVTASVAWSSSDEGVATVNSAGLATGIAEGSATITAAAGGKTGTAALTVNDPFPPAQPTNVTATPISNTQIQITWTDASSNEDEFRIEREQAPNPVGGEVGSGAAGAEATVTDLANAAITTVGANTTSYDDTGLQAGTAYRYWVKACNENGCSDTQQSGNDVVTYTVLVITIETLDVGWVGEAYSQTLMSTGGGGEPQWSITEGAAPPDITLIPTGALTGTPTTAGTTNFTVQASGGGQNVTQALSLTVYDQVAISTTNGPNGAVGFAYDYTLEATGGDETYLWAQEGGVMPPGLVMGPDGTVSGTPTTAGSYDFQVVAHSSTRQVTGTITIQISDSVCPAQTEIPQAQCEVLETFFNDTDGPSWVNNTGWLATLTPCSWFGVSCTEGVVTRLRLSSNGLSGNIPTELGALTDLTNLTLSGNALVGSIPPAIGNLPNLVVLILEHNDLTGAIPPELGNLSYLQTLEIRYQNITGSIPSELGNLTNLRTLGLGSNQLTGPIPPELGNLAEAVFFFLGGNQLSGSIPPELGNLTNVQNFYLNNNQLTGTIPPELGNLSSVTWLKLDSNQLSGPIPPELGDLPSVTHLFLENNQLTGAIPSELGNLHNTLTWLILAGNELSGLIPAELGNLVKLWVLRLNDNDLTGPIPAEFGNLTVLDEIYLEDNQLDSAVPLGLVQVGGALQQRRGTNACRFWPGNNSLSLLDNPDYRAADLDADGFICSVPFPGPLPLPLGMLLR